LFDLVATPKGAPVMTRPVWLSLSVPSAARSLTTLFAAFLLVVLICAGGAWGEEGTGVDQGKADLVKQANAPISSILQLRFQDSYQPEWSGVSGEGNAVTLFVTMPLPKRRLLPLPQLSLLTLPVAITTPDGLTGYGDLKFLDVAIFQGGAHAVWGGGPTFVFPTASRRETGQGKWQVGPAAAVAFFPERWLAGVLVQNPISFAGDHERQEVNLMVLQPFVSYQLGNGWFIRSQPQMVFNWKDHRQQLPLDLGAGRVFKIGRQDVNLFVEPFYNLTHDGAAPKYGVTVGFSLLYPNFWQKR